MAHGRNRNQNISFPKAWRNTLSCIMAVPGEIYAGYSADDMWLFASFANPNARAEPGYVLDFMGTRTRTSTLWNSARVFDGQVMARPVPHDLFEAIEWVGLLKAVVTAQPNCFVMMELGAGWGPWLAAGAVACRSRGLHDVRLLGVEADPGRFALMQTHLADNGVPPDAQTLICAAVGVEAGNARWRGSAIRLTRGAPAPSARRRAVLMWRTPPTWAAPSKNLSRSRSSRLIVYWSANRFGISFTSTFKAGKPSFVLARLICLAVA